MKRPVPLTSIIVPPQIAYFSGPPPAHAGDGGDAGGDPGAGGGGDPNASILDFQAPDIDFASDVLAGKKEGDPLKVTTPPAPKPKGADPAPKPPDPKPPAKPADPPKGGDPAPLDPPAKQLRAELDAVKKERDELKAYREKGDPRLVEAEQRVKEKEAEITAAKERATEYERRLAMADPQVTKKLTDLDDTYAKEATKFYNKVPELSSNVVHQLVRELDALPVGKPEYREARAKFDEKVNEALGGADGVEHRKLNAALDFIERSHEVASERPKILQELNSSALQLKARFEGERYEKEVQTVKQAIENAGKIPEGLEKVDPYHPRVSIKAFMDSLPDDQKAVFKKDIPEFIQRVMAGQKPRTDADYVGMTPAQIKESQSRESAQKEVDRLAAVDVMYNGLQALRLFPTLVKEWQRLRAKVKEDVDGAPPDPTGGGDGGDGSTPNGDLKDFKAPDLAKMTF